jgi:glycosyltransferase involved in cell wall biosynthesis
VNFDLRWNTKRAPLLFRGDSHLLAEGREESLQSSVFSFQREKMKKWVRGLGLRLLFKRFACFLAVGKANADYFRAHGVPESKIVRCPHVVDNAFFLGRKNASVQFSVSVGLKRQARLGDSAGSVQPELKERGLRAELGIPEDELVFLFAGKLEEKKQPLLLLEAFLRADLPKSTLLFVGSGKLEGALRARVNTGHGLTRITENLFRAGDTGAKSCPQEEAANCKLQTANSAHRVVFVPFQNQSRMPDVYRTGDVLVLPSKGRYETWGLAVNEAACCGLPAIVSSHVGCGPDLIEEGITGWVFAAGDVEDLRRCLCEAASNRRRLGQMGSTLQRRVLGDFSYDSAARALFDALSPRTATNTCQEPCEEASAPRW